MIGLVDNGALKVALVFVHRGYGVHLATWRENSTFEHQITRTTAIDNRPKQVDSQTEGRTLGSVRTIVDEEPRELIRKGIISSAPSESW